MNFNVPQYSSLKSDVTLTCEFEMTEGPEERLHSVKWYRFSNSKHMEEFYSWKPKRQPPATRHHIHAVRIDVSYISIYIGLLMRHLLITKSKKSPKGILQFVRNHTFLQHETLKAFNLRLYYRRAQPFNYLRIL